MAPYKYFFCKSLILIITFLIYNGCSSSKQLKSNQERISDIHTIASIVEEYKDITGRYPFAENWDNVKEGYSAVPIMAHLSEHGLPERFRWPPPGWSGRVINVDMFEDYLSKQLGKKIKIPADDRPIKIISGIKPNFYQFLYDGKNYFISCEVSEELPFTRKLGPEVYKYEVGSVSIESKKIRRFLDIKIK